MTSEETPEGEEQTEEAPPEAQEPPAEEPVSSEEPVAEEPATEEAADAAEVLAAPAEEQAGEPAAPAAKPEAKKPKETVPGADLTPIAITDERPLSTEERAALEAEEEERAAREAAAAAAEADDEAIAPTRNVAIAEDALIQATGKRKRSVARVVVRRGEGGIQINGRGLDEYFPRANDQTIVRQALVISGYDTNLDVKVRVHGGGISGQAGAVRHGIARALCDLDPELRGELKRRGLLTRDARKKERRKAGFKKARKRPQFSKR